MKPVNVPENLRVIFFDMDGTLYDSSEMETDYVKATVDMIARLKNLKAEDAKALLKKEYSGLAESLGYKPSITQVLRKMRIKRSIWHDAILKDVNLKKHLKKDAVLISELRRLKKKYTLSVITNNSDAMAEATLKALGVYSFFDDIVTINVSGLSKPNLKIMKLACRRVQVKPHEALMIGDRYELDLEPAEKIGMPIFEVAGPADLYKFLPSL